MLAVLPPTSSQPTPPPSADEARWFAEEVHPHEPALRNFLRSHFPRLSDFDDFIQEAYARLVRARRKGPLTNAKSFLFSTARNVAVDAHRHICVVPFEPIADIEKLPPNEAARDAAETACHRQEIILLRAAVASLPPRCREVVTLRKIDGLSTDEIALRLNLSRQTVYTQLQLGLLKCQRYFAEHGLNPGDRR